MAKHDSTQAQGAQQLERSNLECKGIVDDEQVFPRIDNESFIQRLLLEGDQPESIGSARVQSTNKHGAHTQLIKFEDQQLEEEAAEVAVRRLVLSLTWNASKAAPGLASGCTWKIRRSRHTIRGLFLLAALSVPWRK